MLTFEYKIFLSIAKFYNPALTQRGHYRVAFSLDETGIAQLNRITIYGDGGQVERGSFFSKCVYVSSGRDSFPNVGSCVFHISIPISSSLLSAKDQSVQVILNTEFQCSPGDNLPRGEKCFQVINQRQLSLILTPGMCNNHFLTITSGSIQIAAVGVQIHASLTGMNIIISNSSPPSSKACTQPNPSFDSLLFDTTNLNSSSRSDRDIGFIGKTMSEQGCARSVFRSLEEILQRSYADMQNVLTSYSTFTKVQFPNLPESLALDDDLAIVLQSPVQVLTLTRNIAEIISELSSSLTKLWKKFIWNVHGNESIIKHLAIIYHREKVQYLRQSIRSSATDSSFCSDNIYLEDESQIRNIQQPKYYQHLKPRVYCIETMGAQQDKIFIEEILYTPSKEEITQNQIFRNGSIHIFDNLCTLPSDNATPQFPGRKLSETKQSQPPISLAEISGIKPKSKNSELPPAEITNVPDGSDDFPPISSLNTYTPKRKTSSGSSRSGDQVFCACLPFKRRGKREKNKSFSHMKGPNRYFSQEEFLYPISANQASTPIPPKDDTSTLEASRSHRYVHATRGGRHLKLYSPPLHAKKRGSGMETASDPGPKLRDTRSLLLEDSSRSSQNCTDLDEVLERLDNSQDLSHSSTASSSQGKQLMDSNSQLVVTLELDALTQSVAGAGFQGRSPSFIEESGQKEICINLNDEKLALEDSVLERSIKLHSNAMRSCSPPAAHSAHSFELPHSSGNYQTASYNSFRHREATATPNCVPQFRDITSPYLPQPLYFEYSKDYHLVICVHGLEGNFYDLRLFKTYLSLALPKENLEFLMSDINQGKTFSDIEDMTDNLVIEIFDHLAASGAMPPKYISFIGHSMGTLIIRRLLDREEMKPLLDKLSVFLSLCGPHLGTLVCSSGLVQAGLWLLQKWHKSMSILQLQLKDGETPRESLLYRLSTSRGIQNFKYVVLVGSPQDKYAPYFSSLLHPCPNYDQVPVYREMLENFLAVLSSSNLQLVRYKVHYNIPPSPGNFIGRSAHIAVLDCEQFVEKFVLTCLAPYFADISLHK